MKTYRKFPLFSNAAKSHSSRLTTVGILVAILFCALPLYSSWGRAQSDAKTRLAAEGATSAGETNIQNPEIAKLEAEWLPKTKKGKPADRADAFYSLGKGCFEAHANDLAEKYLKEALALENRPQQLADTHVALAIVSAMQDHLPEAKQEYTLALDIAEKNNFRDLHLVILDSLGNIYRKQHQYDEAEKYFKSAFDLAQKYNSIPTQVISLMNQSMLERTRGNKEKALELLTQAKALTKKTESGRDVANCLLNLGRRYHDLNRFIESTDSYEQAIKIFQEDLDVVQEANTCLNIGENCYEISDYAGARKYYERGLELLKDEPPSANSVKLTIGLGVSDADLGNFAAAEKYHNQALEAAHKLGLRELELEALLNLGYDELLKGDPESALQHLLQGEKLLSSNISTIQRGGFLIAIGRCYKALGQFEPALKYYDEALNLFVDTDKKKEQASVLTSIAVLHFDNHQNVEADKCYRQARSIYTSVDDKRNVALLDYNQAQLMLSQHNATEAMTLYRSALENLKDTGDKVSEGMVLRGIGLTEYFENHPQKALTYYQQSLKFAEESGALEALWDANIGLGKCYKKLGLTDLALTHLIKATELVEKERCQLSRDSFKTYNLDLRNDCFLELLDLYVQLGKPYQAIEVAEKGRARAFLDMLSSRKAGKLGIETFKAPVSMTPGIAPGSSSSAAKAPEPVVVAKAEAGSRGVAVIPRASQIFASTALSPVNATAPNTDEIKSLVQHSKSTVVEYYLLPDKLIAWVIDPDATIHMVPPLPIERDKLSAKVQETYRVITTTPKDKAELEVLSKRREDLLKELYMTIFAPIESFLPKSPDAVVTIVPHGSMFSIPFAALIAPDGNYLIEKHTLAYTPAIGVWRATQKLETNANKEPHRLLAFGNPITKAIEFLGKLPYAEKEVQNIAALFGKENALVKIGQDANKKAFAELAPQYTDVHLATHGLVDEEHPMESSLVLAPTAYDDGMLSVKDIMAMPELKARLVVLSACQTGRGQITGDGVVGLSRAFIIAGTPSVMVSQWNVDDIMTEFQMKQFYKSYLAGGGKSKSLREAQLATIKFMEGGGKMTTRANPRYWAAFQLLGESL